MSAKNDAKKLLKGGKLDARMYRNGHDGPAPRDSIEKRSFVCMARAGFIGGSLLILTACAGHDYEPDRLAAHSNVPQNNTIIQESVEAAQVANPSMKIVVFDTASLYTPRTTKEILAEVKQAKSPDTQPIDPGKLAERVKEIRMMGDLKVTAIAPDQKETEVLTIGYYTPSMMKGVAAAEASSITFSIDDAPKQHAELSAGQAAPVIDQVCIVTAYRQTADVGSLMHDLSGTYLSMDSRINTVEAQSFIIEHEVGHCLNEERHGQIDPFIKNGGESFADSYGLLRVMQKHPDSEIIPIMRDIRTAALVGRGDVVHYAPPAFYNKLTEVVDTLNHQGRMQSLTPEDMIEISEAITSGRESEKFADLNLSKLTIDKDVFDELAITAQDMNKSGIRIDLRTGMIDTEKYAEKISSLSPNGQSLIKAYNGSITRLQGLDRQPEITYDDRERSGRNLSWEAEERFNNTLDETFRMQGDNPHLHLETVAYQMQYLQDTVSNVQAEAIRGTGFLTTQERKEYIDDFIMEPGADGLSVAQKWTILHERAGQIVRHIDHGPQIATQERETSPAYDPHTQER
jgi:hypothetical protein